MTPHLVRTPPARRHSRDWIIARTPKRDGEVTFDRHGRLVDAVTGEPVLKREGV